MSWANEIVEEAWYCTRPLRTDDIENAVLKLGAKFVNLHHHGIKVLTNKGHEWLIHNAKDKKRGEFGPFVTSASNMIESNWTCKSFKVNRKNVNLSDCLKAMDWKGTAHTYKDWLASGTCIGAADQLRTYLEKPNLFTNVMLNKIH